MTEVAQVTVTAPENPPPPNPPPASVSSTETAAETVVQAAIQTGAAAERTEQAAAKAEESASKARNLVEELTQALRPDLDKISERLAALEAMEEAETEELELREPNSTLNSLENAPAVLLPEPRAAEPKSGQKPAAPERGGTFRRLFLNR